MNESLGQFFLEDFRRRPLDLAYGQRRGYRAERYTYAQVLAMAVRVRQELVARGISTGDRVAIWGENSAQWVAAFFGCVLQGVIVVPIDDAGSAEFSERVLRQTDAKLIVLSRKHKGNSVHLPALILEDLEASVTRHSAEISSGVAVTRDQVLEIVFTSGATAEPQGVVITHGNVLANIAPLEREMQQYLKYERFIHPIRFLSLLPLSHVFGQFLGMFLPPLLGGTVIFQQELKPAEIIDSVRRERVSVVVCVPRMLQSLQQTLERDLEDSGRLGRFRSDLGKAEGKHFLHRWWIFRSIRRRFGWKFWAFICGGATLDRETEEFWFRLGYAAIQGYGLTETTSLISVNHPFRVGRGSIGKVLPGREIKLAADGEIMTRGGGVAARYSGSGKIVAIADAEGWYCTGDIGALDEAGNLYFKGRKKEVIVTAAGLNIYPDDLEEALSRQPEVKDCVVVGLERGGNSEPCAVLILRGEASLDKLVQRANGLLAEYQRMHVWVRWPEEVFPRTGTQKPKRAEIAARAARILQSDVSTTAGESAVAQMVRKMQGRDARMKVNSETELRSELGLTSLDRVELVGALEDRYQVDLRDVSFSAMRTVGDLEKLIRGEARPRIVYHYPAWVLGWPVAGVRWLAQYLLVRPAMLVLGWPRVIGRENLDGCGGPLLIVCNHLSDVDLGFVQAALPAHFRNKIATATGGEALEALRSPAFPTSLTGKIYNRMRWFLGVSLLNLFPLPRAAGFRKSFDYAGRAVDAGYSVLVFPEGHHTADGQMNSFRAGIGLLAANLNIPVLPMRIDGLYEIRKAGRRFARFGEIKVRIGRPILFSLGEDPAKIAATLQSAVETL